MKVLLVISEPAQAAELSKVCAGANISCQLAEGGFYALTMLERDKPDAIVASKDVLDMAGLDFYEIVRSDESLEATAFVLLDEDAAPSLSDSNDLVLNQNASALHVVNALLSIKSSSEEPALPKTIMQPRSPQISGTLEVLTLFDLMMSLNQNRHSGKLYLRIADEEATVVLRSGEIVHAEIQAFTGEQALIQIFLLSEGTQDTEFYFERMTNDPSLDAFNSIKQSSKELLFKVAIELDHMREKIGS